MPAPSPNHRPQPTPQPPMTPSHPSLLPAISPSALETTPAPLHTLPPQFHHPPPPQPRLGVPSQMPPPNGHNGHMHAPSPLGAPMDPMGPGHGHGQGHGQGHGHGPAPGPMGPGPMANVFGQVMGTPGQVPQNSAPAKVYASVYSGIPVFEAMIRGISVMRRTSDSWVNATQILKVAGIPKSARTKILEKEILSGVHEKVQGGYGKYQGTWIPFGRGQDLAAQYGVTQFLAPIFDFVPSPTNVAALPIIRHGTPERKGALLNRTPAAGRIYSPLTTSALSQSTLPPPPQFEMPMYHPEPLAPPADINGYGLPPDMYIDQFGQPMYTEVEMEPPAKRIKVDEDAGAEPEPDADADADESDDDEPTTPLPASMRLATKPFRPKPDAKNRAKLLSLFHTEEDVRGVLGEAPEFIDMVIDNQGHTALHWACALAKVSVMTQLIELGADIHRGNYAGETPLIRSVLTTNHAEAGTFDQLLEQLAPSIRTLDQAYRSVLHHVSLIAGVKGRASSARQYMASLLEHVAKQGGATLKTLVDVSDVHGDTALNVAARVGNKGLITLLLDAGADKAKANKLGLRPVDFGVEQEALSVAPAENVVSGLKTEMRPERKSRDVQKNIASIFGTINDAFSTEMLAKQTKLNATEASVRHATRALADKRGQVQRAQAALSEMEHVDQRAENVRKAMGLDLDWAGGASASASTQVAVPVEDPPRGSEGALVKLRRVAMWEDRVSGLLEERIRSLQGESTDKAVKYRRLVSLCTKVPVDKVDGMLDGLVAAIESDGQSVDLSRISGFMSRMKATSASASASTGA